MDKSMHSAHYPYQVTCYKYRLVCQCAASSFKNCTGRKKWFSFPTLKTLGHCGCVNQRKVMRRKHKWAIYASSKVKTCVGRPHWNSGPTSEKLGRCSCWNSSKVIGIWKQTSLVQNGKLDCTTYWTYCAKSRLNHSVITAFWISSHKRFLSTWITGQVHALKRLSISSHQGYVQNEDWFVITLRAGFEPARGDPIGFRVQRLNLSAITACSITFYALTSPLSRSVHFNSKTSRSSLLKYRLEMFVMEDTFWALESKDKCTHYPYQVTKYMLKIKNGLPLRCEQGSNLRRETPLDFKSNALTTRPSQLAILTTRP